MDKNELPLAALEALLFVHGEPLGLAKIQSVLGVTREVAEEAIRELSQSFAGQARGLTLVTSGEKIQLVTKPEFGSILNQFIKEELSEDLTPASIEALSIISYLGPISRHRLEYIRGVNSSFIVRSLLLRGLVERVPDPGRPSGFLYQPSFALLKHLGVTRLEELPEYEKFRSVLTRFESGEAKNETPSPETHERET